MVALTGGGEEVNDKTIAEIQPGVYDGWFALVVWTTFAAFAAGLVWLVGWRFIDDKALTAPEPGYGGEQAAQLYTLEVQAYESRIFSVVVLVALAAGGVLLLAGAALAALEVRGRLWKVVVTTTGPKRELISQSNANAQVDAVPQLAEAAAKVLEAAKWVRGTVLVIVAGSAVVLFSLGVTSCEFKDKGASNPTVSPSASPSATPDATATPTTTGTPSPPALGN